MDDPAQPPSPDPSPPDPQASDGPRPSARFGLDSDLLDMWFTPEGLTAVLTLGGAVVAVVGTLVAVLRDSPALAALGLGLVAVVLAIVGVVLAARLAEPSPDPPSDPPPPPFAGDPVGREQEIGAICRALRERKVVSVVGRRGVGTSTCAKKAVEMLSAPDDRSPTGDQAPGSVYMDLRRGHVPKAREEVLAELAVMLGADGDADADHLCSKLSDEGRLLFLDNADTESQVIRLLPGAGQHHKVLVVGTVALANVEPVEVHSLKPAAAARLVHAAAGEPEGAAEDRWVELAELCGCQPRLLTAAGDLIHRQRYGLAGLIDALRRIASAPAHTSSERLVNEASQDLPLLAKQDIGYAALPRRARRLLRRLAVLPAVPAVPGGEPVDLVEPGEGGRLVLCPVDLDTMAAVAGLPPERVRPARNDLADAGFLGKPGDLRSIHPLHAPVARLHLLRDERRQARQRAHTRLLKQLARQAEQHAATRSEANRRWFEQNEVLLRAAVVAAGSPSPDAPEPLPRGARRWWFRLAVALCVWYATEGRLAEWHAACDAVGDLPRGDRQLLPSAALEHAWRHNELAAIARRRGELDRASDLFDGAAEKMPDWRHLGEAQIRTNQALVMERQAQQLRNGDDRAVEDRVRSLLEQALRKLDEAGPLRARSDTIGRALTEQMTGLVHWQLARSDAEAAVDGDRSADRGGHLAEARRHLVRAADRFREAGELRGEATALTNLVLVAGQMRNPGIARSNGEVALKRYDELEARTGRDDVEGRAAVLLNLGAVLVTADTPAAEQARVWLEQSRALRGEEPTSGLGRTLLYLGDAESKLGNEAAARDRWRQAEKIFAGADRDERDGRGPAGRGPVSDRDGLDAATRRLSGSRRAGGPPGGQ